MFCQTDRFMFEPAAENKLASFSPTTTGSCCLHTSGRSSSELRNVLNCDEEFLCHLSASDNKLSQDKMLQTSFLYPERSNNADSETNVQLQQLCWTLHTWSLISVFNQHVDLLHLSGGRSSLQETQVLTDTDFNNHIILFIIIVLIVFLVL